MNLFRRALLVTVPLVIAIAIPTLALAAPVAVSLVGKTQLASVSSPLVLNDTGTIKGSPIGSGTIALTYTLHPKSGIAVTTFTITNARGTVSGKAVSSYAVTRLHISFSGAAKLTGGTAAYAGITSGRLEFNAIHSVTGKREAIRFAGRAITRP